MKCHLCLPTRRTLLGAISALVVLHSAALATDPPNNALRLTTAQARVLLRQSIDKRYLGASTGCVMMFCATYTGAPASEMAVGSSGIHMVQPYSYDKPKPGTGTEKIDIRFRDRNDYIEVFEYPHMRSPKPLYAVGWLPKPDREPIGLYTLGWTDRAAAQNFADAFNRLIYAAHNGGDEQEFAAFRAAAQKWRDNPSKPPLSDAADRHRILAENAIQEKDVNSAAEHYQSALESDPMWPQGWFNLALISGQLKDYAGAADAMRHYLELVPDATDAKSAREQMIIWDDKAKQGAK